MIFTQSATPAADAVLPKLENIPECRPCWDKLEQGNWSAGLAFESHGVRLGIRTNNPAIIETLACRLPPGSIPASTPFADVLYSLRIPTPAPRPGVQRQHLLYQGVTLLARTGSLDEALNALESDLHRQVAERAADHLFVHAGVAGWQGRAVVIPGRSFCGKTHLTAALIQAGADYFSDEYAVFDASGLVWPFPKPLSLRGADGLPLPKRTAASFGSHAAVGPLPVGLILDTAFVPGASWRPRRLSPGAALMALLDNTVQIRSRPQNALAILHQAVSGAAAVKSRRGEAAAAVDWAMTHLSKQH